MRRNIQSEEEWAEEATEENDGISMDEIDGISTDENGTEWWEDEEGVWWHREEGWEDWARLGRLIQARAF